MKSATTSLRHLLAEHPNVFMPKGELFFFDIDDFFEHPAFFLGRAGNWRDWDFAQQQPALLAWYERFFSDARPGQLVGEDSTTYLASDRAASRIAAFNPKARIFMVLRDPVERAYSAYWHLVRTGYAVFDFEKTLTRMPEAVLQLSYYRAQVERFLHFFPRQQIQILLFEEFITDPRRSVQDCFRFLGLDPGAPQPTGVNHLNAGTTPRWPGLELWWNRRQLGRERNPWLGRLPAEREGVPSNTEQRSIAERMYRKLNPLRKGQPPPMRPETRQFLTALLRRENEGLGRLIGRDLDQVWFR